MFIFDAPLIKNVIDTKFFTTVKSISCLADAPYVCCTSISLVQVMFLVSVPETLLASWFTNFHVDQTFIYDNTTKTRKF